MKVKIIPGKNNRGPIIIPPSKSISHRAILCASIAKGVSKIYNVSFSDDIKATLNCMKLLGANISYCDDHIEIEGISDLSLYNGEDIDCGESGSTLRFLIPLFSLTNKKVNFIGHGRLLKRPQDVYEKIFKENGLTFIHNDEKILIDGSLKPGNYKVRGDISSQFITGLIYALLLLNAESTIEIEEPFESKQYVYMSIDILKIFGAKIDMKDNIISIKAHQSLEATDYTIDGDYSQSCFFASLGLINQDIVLQGLKDNNLQGDKAIVDIIKDLNGDISLNNNSEYIVKRSTLKPSVIDLKDCPDLGPMLFALSTQIEGETKFINAKRLRIKESDRIASMEEELKKLGCNISSTDDEVIVKGKTHLVGDVTLDGHNDHRIVMALSILGTICDKPIIINGVEAINKSYPTFIDDLRKSGIEVEMYD